MEKDGRPPNSGADDHPTVSKDVADKGVSVLRFFKHTRDIFPVPPEFNTSGSYSDLFGSLLKVRTIQRGKISCLVTVKPPIMNIYGGMHGGAVAAISELMATACARTLVGEEKDVFLGEMSTSYLSSVPKESKVVVDGSVIRSGRNITVVSIEFKLEESSKLAAGEMDEGGRKPDYSGTRTISIKEMNDTRVVAEIPPELDTAGGYSNLFGSLLKVRTIQRGKISCLVTVKPAIMSKVVVNGSVIRSGRNITVVAIEFKLEESSKLIYTSQTTLYHLPTASL